MARSAIKPKLYHNDLAQIHIEGYGFHWQSAAPSILGWMQEHGIETGSVVDLGCGGGQWLAHLAGLGFDTIGIDVSSSMIQLAKRNSPRSKFICGSFDEVDIQSCDVVTSQGEPLNYLNNGRLIRRTINNVYKSLRPNGLFVFDVRHPPKRKVAPVNHSQAGRDWFCYARIEEDASQLVRDITTFRRVGKHFRRDHEVHRLKLFSKLQMLRWLRGTGFRVRTSSSYGDYALAKRQSVFICRKP